MLPSVNATGWVSRAGLYKQLSEKGGVVEFTISCKIEDARDGDNSPFRYFKVNKWVGKDDNLAASLSEGVIVTIDGRWEVDIAGGKEYNKIRANRVEVIEAH
jgi:hypothetical protein